MMTDDDEVRMLMKRPSGPSALHGVAQQLCLSQYRMDELFE